ncbi:DUF3987 domain-containing protein [Saccharothrix luteola]|uniref:DUF3987 domain-containing protein n=1 Tax=Saccharothrix luteola TaxID=2893018 RepID=UPI001E5660F5|nr:DUF3987 domain-containing protein [Saccharothrix luteola]MCC8247409.1 DUF3987 domain-containing protein [Saccharothrix luteola]
MGTATNAALALFGAADPYFRAENVHSGLSSGEGLAAAFATDDATGAGEAAGKSGKSPRLLPEGDCRLLALETEWASVMARMKREGNTLGALLRQAWEGGNLSTLNVTARMAARSHLGIVAHITPKEFSAKVSAADLAGGTYNRFLPVAVAQSKHFPTDPDPALMEELAASLSARLTRAGGFDALGFTPAAHVAWQRLQVEFNGHLGADGPVEEFISRAAANCVRIAALYAALDRTDHITPDHMTAAAALVRYSIDSARAIVDNATNDKATALDQVHRRRRTHRPQPRRDPLRALQAQRQSRRDHRPARQAYRRRADHPHRQAPRRRTTRPGQGGLHRHLNAVYAVTRLGPDQHKRRTPNRVVRG